MQSHNFRKKLSALEKWWLSHERCMQFIIFITDYFENFYQIQTQNMNTSDKEKENHLKKEGMFQKMDHMMPCFCLGNKNKVVFQGAAS